MNVSVGDRFQTNLKYYRHKQKMSQLDLGKAIGCNRVSIARLENGSRKPQFKTLDALANPLKIDVTKLFEVGATWKKKKDFIKTSEKKYEKMTKNNRERSTKNKKTLTK